MSASPSSRLLLSVLKLVGTCVLIGLLVWRFEGSEAPGLLIAANWGLIGVALLLYGLTQFISSFRWLVLLRGAGAQIEVLHLFRDYLVGMFFNNFLPTNMGGDLVKMARVHAHIKDEGAAAMSVLLARLLGLMAMMTIGAVAVVTDGGAAVPDEVLLAAAIASAVAVLGTALLLSGGVRALMARFGPRLRPEALARFFAKLVHTLANYTWMQRVTWYALALSFVVQILNLVVYVILAHALGLGLSVGFVALCYPLVTLAALLPVSIAGLGVRESIMALLFVSAGYEPAGGISLGLAWYAVVLLCSLLGGVTYLLEKMSLAGASAE